MEQVTESRRKPIVVGIGELLWDMLPSGKKAGGAPINFVYHASCLGAEGYAISAVGDDELGKEIVDELDKNHIQHLIEKVPYPTGYKRSRRLRRKTLIVCWISIFASDTMIRS